MGEGDFLLFEFSDAFNEDDNMTEKALAEKRYSNFWSGIQLADLGAEDLELEDLGDLPESSKNLYQLGIEGINREFEPIFSKIQVVRRELKDDKVLLRSYPEPYGESGANYWRSVRTRLTDQFEETFRSAKSSDLSQLKANREDIASRISSKFQELKEVKMKSDRAFQTLYFTYELWQGAQSQIGTGIKPTSDREAWKLVKLLRDREFHRDSVIEDYIKPDFSQDNLPNFRRTRSTLEDYVSDDILDTAENLYKAEKILVDSQLQVDLRDYLLLEG